MRRPAALFAGAVAAAGLAALAAGIVAIGPPSEIRERRLDTERIADLREIAGAIDRHLHRTGALPAGLDALNTADQPVALRSADPATAEPYDYAATGARSYRLCATFGRPTPTDGDGGNPDRTPGFWRHGAGRQCFSIDVPPAPR
ncbi:hypothetical protein [Azospirillum sp. ST 5-10]|uniref:hypothetical protein n=1 Tax=unclassified Azospirillum TaxID=2630922 RepID=UPI003F4A1226